MELEILGNCCLCGNRKIQILDEDCNISRCNSCNFVFHNPRPSLPELVKFYSQPTKYDHWLAEEESRDYLWQNRLRKMARTLKPGTLLDIGTGTGQFLHWARKQYQEVYGTEVSRSAIAIARDKYDLNIFEGTIEDLSFESMTFDNISLFHVLEHVSDPRRVLEKCYGLLKENGILVIAVPNELQSWRYKSSVRRGRIYPPQVRVGKLGLPLIQLDGFLEEIHLSHFTPSVLANALKQVGFTVIENSLDPYLPNSTWKSKTNYLLCSLIQTLSGLNFYETIWIVGRKLSVKE